MVTVHTCVISVCLLSALGPAQAEPSNPWVEVGETDNIRVWARAVDNSSIREVKAEAVINASSHRVWDVLLDVSHYTEFMPYVAEARIVGSAGPQAKYVYQRLDPPLVADRDYTLRVEGDGDLDKGSYRLRWTPANEQGPPRPDAAVRIEVCSGTWKIESLTENRAQATYYLYTDPGGALPNWIANLANRRSVPQMMAAVRNRAQDPSWTAN